MKKCFIVFFLLSSLSAVCQTTQKLPLSKKEFQLAVQQYRAMWESKEYMEYQFGQSDFAGKLNCPSLPFDAKDQTIQQKWFEDNWKTTKFNSLEELKSEDKKLRDKLSKIVRENEGLFKLMERASYEELIVIIAPEKETFDRNYRNMK